MSRHPSKPKKLCKVTRSYNIEVCLYTERNIEGLLQERSVELLQDQFRRRLVSSRAMSREAPDAIMHTYMISVWSYVLPDQIVDS